MWNNLSRDVPAPLLKEWDGDSSVRDFSVQLKRQTVDVLFEPDTGRTCRALQTLAAAARKQAKTLQNSTYRWKPGIVLFYRAQLPESMLQAATTQLLKALP